MKTEPTPEIRKVMEQVQEVFPEVVYVIYGIDNRWNFTDEHFESPIFGGKIDQGLLEDAADSVEFIPSIFYFPKKDA